LVFELWNNSGEYTVRVVYNGEVKKIPICGYRIECTLYELKKWFEGFKVNNLDIACGFIAKNKTFYAVIFLMGSVIIGFIFYICYLLKRVK
jgi:hypothetical protein